MLALGGHQEDTQSHRGSVRGQRGTGRDMDMGKTETEKKKRKTGERQTCRCAV